MKEIGEFLKSARISNGVSLEEAAEDLSFSVIQLENIEGGNIRAFKDVFALRELVKEYGKYLGVKTDEIIDEFNDFMFEHTSKISLDDLLEARKLAKEKEEEEKPKVISPYTNIHTPKFNLERFKKMLLILAGIILGILVFCFIWIKINDSKGNVSSELMRRSMEDVYECTY